MPVNGNNNRHIGVVEVISMVSHANEMVITANPNPTTERGCERSTIRPTKGANTAVATAIGAVSSAARVGDSPHADCA
jgi:hypothetical protein